MTVSIALLFKSAKWDEVGRTLDSMAVPAGQERWQYPSHDEPCVWLYPYDDLLDEYEDEDIDRLFKVLDAFPASILCIELSGSQREQACVCATELVIGLLEQFDGIVDDFSFACWTLEEIRNGVTKDSGKFLDVYRGV